MNERIQKIATEIGISVEYLTNTKQIVLIEKFSEEIVRECARVFWSIDDGELHTEYVDTLKKHFGIKE